MRGFNLRTFFAGVMILFALPLLTVAEDIQPVQSDWLELVKGYKGETLGAEMMEIEDSEQGRTVTLAIPKESIDHPDTIEEVVVVGQKPEELEPLEIEYEWLEDYDNDNYGLVIYLGSNSRWPIRLYLNSGPGFVR